MAFRPEPQNFKLWDIFEDPPRKKTSGSSEVTRQMEIFLKLMKVLTYALVFVAVLIGGSISKLSFIFMTSQVMGNVTPYCVRTGKLITMIRK